MKRLLNKILRLVGRRDLNPTPLDNTFIEEAEMEEAIEGAEAAMRERDWGRAAALWRRVLDQFGDQTPQKVHLRLSQALRRDGDVIAAQTAAREGLKRHPESGRLREELAELATSEAMQAALERAEAAMANKNWSEATALWREVIRRFGDHAPQKTHLRLSKALRQDGDVIGAQAAVLEGLKRDPESERLQREIAVLVEAGEKRPQLRRLPLIPSSQFAPSHTGWERVVTLWEEVMGSTSTPTPEMANGFAGALCQVGRFREADEVLQRGLAPGIDRGKLQSVFDSDVLRTQFLRGVAEGANDVEAQGFEESHLEWYRLAVGARRLRDASGTNAAVTAPSAIWVCDYSGWGNSVRQFIHALGIAERLDVPRLYIPPTWYLEGDDPIYFRDHEVIQSERPGPDEALVLRGRFMVLQALDTVLAGTESPSRRLAELRPFTRFRDREPLGENDLVIHIRSGDVFRKDKLPTKNYGQPPLAYYLKVLQQRRWRSVHVVYENDQNPVIEPLLNRLRADGIEPNTVVTAVMPTIEFLLAAKTIVAGRGTFIPIIAGLSSNLRCVYTFEGTPMGLDRWGRPGVAQIDVVDERGAYRRVVMSSNWENRPDQVELMLHYPESALRVIARPRTRDEGHVRDQHKI